MLAGTREERGEVDQPRRVGAVVAVDGLVVVADTEHGAAGRCEEPDEQEVRWREVLELVDQHDPARPLRGVASLGLGEQHEQRPVDLVVEVDDALPFQPGPVRRPHRGQAVDVAVVLLLGLVGVDQPETDETQGFDPRRHRIAVALLRERHEVADDPPDLGLVDRSPRPGLRRERRGAVDDRQGDRVERADVEARQVGRALAHLLLRPLVERHQAERPGRHVPLPQEVPGPLGEHAGLAGSGWRDDAGGTTWVGHGRELVGGEVGVRPVGAGGRERPLFDRHHVHHGDIVDRLRVAERPGVDPHGRAVG